MKIVAKTWYFRYAFSKTIRFIQV